MNIFIVTPYNIWPTTYGGAVRTFNLAKTLHSLGHEVTLFSANTIPENQYDFSWKSFLSANKASLFFNPNLTNTLKNEIQRRHPDLIIMEFPYHYFSLKRALPPNPPFILYDAHNVEYDRFKRLQKPWISKIVRVAEKATYKNADAVITVSETDKIKFERIYRKRKNVLILENGVDTNTFFPGTKDRSLIEKYNISSGPVILYFGAYDYLPNKQAAYTLKNTLWKKIKSIFPTAKLLLIGKHPPFESSYTEDIIVTGAVDDIVSHIRLGDALIVPLNSGGGTRLKIIEALATGIPVASTPIGAEGIKVPTDNKSIIISELDGLPDALFTLLNHDKHTLSTDARNFAETYDWTSLIKRIEWETLQKK